MIAELPERVDRRTERTDPQSQWMDVQVIALETRRELGRAYIDLGMERDPRPLLDSAGARMVRLEQYARRRAGEAAGISYISPGQVILFPEGPDAA